MKQSYMISLGYRRGEERPFVASIYPAVGDVGTIVEHSVSFTEPELIPILIRCLGNQALADDAIGTAKVSGAYVFDHSIALDLHCARAFGWRKNGESR